MTPRPRQAKKSYRKTAKGSSRRRKTPKHSTAVQGSGAVPSKLVDVEQPKTLRSVKGLPKQGRKKTNQPQIPIPHRSLIKHGITKKTLRGTHTNKARYSSKNSTTNQNQFSNIKKRNKEVKGKIKASKSANSKPVPNRPKFHPLNATNVQLIKDNFESFCPGLYDKIAKSGKYSLYLFEYYTHEVYLIENSLIPLIKQLSRAQNTFHAGLFLGTLAPRKTKTGFVRSFFLSYEGGSFIYSLIKNKYPELLSELQVITISDYAEKQFLYGQNLSIADVESPTEHLRKKKLIFVLNRKEEYIGLCLLRVQQAGVNKPDEITGYKPKDPFSRSEHFMLSLMHLTDAGYYLRKGG